MKKCYLCLMLFVLTAFVLDGCKKDRGANNNGKQYAVKFNVSGFSVTAGAPVKNNSTKLKTNSVQAIDNSNPVYLNYLLFDSEEKLVTKKVYLVTDSAFNPVIADHMPAGTYSAIFVTNTLEGTISQDGKTLSYVPDADSFTFKETFYKKITFTVGTGDITQNVTLIRVTSELQVVIKDAIPPNSIKLSVSLKESTINSFSLLTGLTNLNYFYSPSEGVETLDDKIGVVNFATTPIPILNTSTPVTVRIEVSADVPVIRTLAFRTIGGVILKPNTRTVLTGYLFTNPPSGGSGFDMTFKTDFAADSIKIHF